MRLENIELNEARIDDEIISVTLRNTHPNAGSDPTLISKLLSTFSEKNIPLEEIIFVSYGNGVENGELFLSFKQKFGKRIRKLISSNSIFNELFPHFYLNIQQVSITGVGFARSNEFLYLIYNSFEAQNINILAQMCSDIEVIVFCEKTETNKEITKALSDIGVKYSWKD